MKWEKIHSLMEFFILSPCVYYHAVSSACARYFTFRPLTRGCFVFNALGCLLLLPSLPRFNFPDRQCFLPHSSLSNCNQIDCISCYVIYESKVIFLNTIYRHRCVLIGSTHCDGGGFLFVFCGLSRIVCVEAKSEGEQGKKSKVKPNIGMPARGRPKWRIYWEFLRKNMIPACLCVVCTAAALRRLAEVVNEAAKKRRRKKRRNSNEPAEGNV